MTVRKEKQLGGIPKRFVFLLSRGRKLHRESPTSFGGVRLRSGGTAAREERQRREVHRKEEGDTKEVGTADNEFVVVLDLFYNCSLEEGRGRSIAILKTFSWSSFPPSTTFVQCLS